MRRCLHASLLRGVNRDAGHLIHTFTSGVIRQTGINELSQYLLTQWAKHCCEIVRNLRQPP